MRISIDALINALNASTLLESLFDLATAANVPVTSWREDDPTRIGFVWLAQREAEREQDLAAFANSAFLSTTNEDYIEYVAPEVYGVEIPAEQYATPTVSLENEGGGYWQFAEGDITAKNTTTGATYHNTTGGTLEPLGTLDLVFTADVPGSDGSAGLDEVDELVTVLLGVVIAGSTVATAADRPDLETIKTQCANTLGALSPNGPADAAAFVAANPTLTGVTTVTGVKVDDDNDDGTATVYVRGALGAVADLAPIQSALSTWAEPIGFAFTAAAASALGVAFDIEVSGDLPDDAEALIEAALTDLLTTWPIGELLPISRIYQAIHSAVVDDDGNTRITAVTLNTPAAAVAVAAFEFPYFLSLAYAEV